MNSYRLFKTGKLHCNSHFKVVVVSVSSVSNPNISNPSQQKTISGEKIQMCSYTLITHMQVGILMQIF